MPPPQPPPPLPPTAGLFEAAPALQIADRGIRNQGSSIRNRAALFCEFVVACKGAANAGQNFRGETEWNSLARGGDQATTWNKKEQLLRGLAPSSPRTVVRFPRFPVAVVKASCTAPPHETQFVR